MNRHTKRALRFAESAVDFLIIAIFAAFILTGLYTVYDSYLLYRDASAGAVSRYRPEYGQGDGGGKEITEGMVAWVTIEDTNIDHPVMQGKDNNEFLNRDPFGNSSLSGSIFLDFRNSADFSDPYSLVYGHHMSMGGMFGDIDKFLKKSFWDSHKEGTLEIKGEKHVLRFFALSEADSLDDVIFAPTEKDGELLKKIRGNHIYLREEDFPEGPCRIVALSTCQFPATQYRTVLFGVLDPGTSRGSSNG